MLSMIIGHKLIKGPHEKLFTESDVCKDNKDKVLKFQAVLEKASKQIVITVDNFCDGIKKSKLDTKYCNRATFLTRGDFPITIENYTSVGFDENGKLFSFTNASGSFERNDAGKYINSENEEAYQTLTPHETDRFYVMSKPNNSFEITLKGNAKPKPDFVYKPKVEDDNIPGPISDLPAAIAPSNGTTNLKGGTFGCTRTYPASNTKQESPRAAQCNYEKAPSGGYYRFHGGLDILLPFGTLIKSILGGKVTQAVSNDGDKNGLGSFVTIQSKLKEGTIVIYKYGHLTGSSIKVKVGESIKKGEIFANTGNIQNIGNITRIQQHCHLQVYLKSPSNLVNPKDYVSVSLKNLIQNYE